LRGDFNARTGEEGGKVGEDDWMEEEKGRRSKDKKTNKEGRKLVEFIKERGWWILNGGIRGDEEGNWTYTGGRGESVIDVILVNEEMEEDVESLEIGEQVDSDHHPVIIRLKEEERKKVHKGRENKIGHRGRWDVGSRVAY
jgi:exonuclease III